MKNIEKQYLRTGTPEEIHTISRNNSFSLELDRIDFKKPPNKDYLVAIADLNINHLPYLKKVKKFIDKQLIDIYDVNFQKDKIEMFFHFPTTIETLTLPK